MRELVLASLFCFLSFKGKLPVEVIHSFVQGSGYHGSLIRMNRWFSSTSQQRDVDSLMCFVVFSVGNFVGCVFIVGNFVGRSFRTHRGGRASVVSVASAWVISLFVAFVRVLVAVHLSFL